jgi:hypothetical protein
MINTENFIVAITELDYVNEKVNKLLYKYADLGE